MKVLFPRRRAATTARRQDPTGTGRWCVPRWRDHLQVSKRKGLEISYNLLKKHHERVIRRTRANHRANIVESQHAAVDCISKKWTWGTHHSGKEKQDLERVCVRVKAALACRICVCVHSYLGAFPRTAMIPKGRRCKSLLPSSSSRSSPTSFPHLITPPPHHHQDQHHHHHRTHHPTSPPS